MGERLWRVTVSPKPPAGSHARWEMPDNEGVDWVFEVLCEQKELEDAIADVIGGFSKIPSAHWNYYAFSIAHSGEGVNEKFAPSEETVPEEELDTFTGLLTLDDLPRIADAAGSVIVPKTRTRAGSRAARFERVEFGYRDSALS